MNSLQAIQFMIAPVFMVSGCALLLSTSNNKSSSTIARIRQLSQEKNKDKAQIENLLLRLKYIRNAAFSFDSAVAFFVLSSLAIGATHFSKSSILDSLTIILFMLGMAAVLTGIMFLSIESKKGYDIVSLAVK